ncbi:DUF3572 domain-containing protein [Aestuariivirga sp.]|uniref:DUF3572 domain-containing protein n=1 Tax=Aestuariivirga sp. TaxID=2650926 RepID=UPI003919F5C3
MHQEKSLASSAEAEIIALKVLGFLASEPERLSRFMDLTGLGPQAIRASAAEPAFLGGLMDHLLADETLLLIFCEEHDLEPERIQLLRRKLPGAALDL